MKSLLRHLKGSLHARSVLIEGFKLECQRRSIIAILSPGSGPSLEAATKARRCFGWRMNSISNSRTDGMTRNLTEGVEGDLDLQMAAAMARGSARICIYQAFSNNPGIPISAAKAFSARRLPDVTSLSYGDCEINTGASFRNLTDSVYVRLGLAGVSNFVASGDSGSATCWRGDSSMKGKTVSYPASSPYVTAVGGSRLVLNKKNQRANEVVWDDKVFTGGNIAPAVSHGAGGGGKSAKYRRPVWQPKNVTRQPRRTLPDLAAHASGAPAWPVYVTNPKTGSGSPLSPRFIPVWGTSSSTPLTAASFALISAKERANGRGPLGFVNPWIYRLPRSSGAFFDIIRGNNDVTNNGCCQAKHGYDMASGIGAPNFYKISRRTKAPR